MNNCILKTASAAIATLDKLNFTRYLTAIPCDEYQTTVRQSQKLMDFSRHHCIAWNIKKLKY